MSNPVYTEYVKFWNLYDDIKAEFPKFDIIPKEKSRLMLAIYYCTLMYFWNRDFMKRYITTAFGKVYMPEAVIGTSSGMDVLRHERVHLRDARRWPILFELSYLIFPLPCVFTMRAYWEYRAYCESLITIYDRFGYVPRAYLEFYVSLFANSEYLWMFPFPKTLTKFFMKFLDGRGIKVK